MKLCPCSGDMAGATVRKGVRDMFDFSSQEHPCPPMKKLYMEAAVRYTPSSKDTRRWKLIAPIGSELDIYELKYEVKNADILSDATGDAGTASQAWTVSCIAS